MYFKGKRLVALVLSICMVLSTGFSSVFTGTFYATETFAVYDLKVNGIENPVAIDPGIPLFSWKINASGRGFNQTAYQIIVKDLFTEGVVWDSGKVLSDKSSNVEYSGNNLASDSGYSWQVKVWNNDDIESEFSQVATFRIGLAKADWTAKYIWDGTINQNDFAYFRKDFVIEKPVKQAIVYTTAHNDYQLYLNGEWVGAGPARSDPYTYGQYCAYDVTNLLEIGQNAFAALAHWHGVWSNSGVNASPAYILEARIIYEDGTKDTVITDSSWKTAAKTPYTEENPIYFGHYGGVNNRPSIKYNANNEIDSWNTIGFDASGWQGSAEVNRDNYNMYAQLVSEQKEMDFLSPLSINKSGDNWIVDFGKCISGWPKLNIRNNTNGDIIKVQYWEVEKGWGDAGYDTYICKGGEEVFYAPFVRHTSFRLLEISGYRGTLSADDIRGIVSYSYVDKTGEFSCSDERLNKVYEMSERSGRQNIQQGIISVDANREQSPWTADSWNIGIGALYNHDSTMLIDKIIKDYAGEQLRSGNFLTCSPARDYNSEMIEWSLYWPMLLWEQYLFSGDEQLLRDYYPNLERFINYLVSYKSPGSGLYDPPGWRASDYAGGSIQNGGDNIATNSQIYMVLNIAANIADKLNNPNAQKYKKSAGDLYRAINVNLLVDGQKYKTTSGSGQFHPLGTAWALRSGVVPPAFKARVTKWLAQQKKPYNIGGYGGDALYSGLYAAELGRIAAKDFERYDNMLNTNNTNWESFGELSIDNMGNHAWTAYPSYLLQKYVGGIQPTGGGFSTFDIKPVIGGLDYANATVPTIKGDITVNWKKIDKENFEMEVSIPANTTANIYLPDNDMSEVSVVESGSVIFSNGQFSPCDGITSGKISGNYVVFSVGSGAYSFKITGVPKNTPEIGDVTEPPVLEDGGIILDDDKAVYLGNWVFNGNSNEEDRYGSGFRYAATWTGESPNATATYSITAEYDGIYDFYGWWCVHSNRATNAPFTISNGQISETARINQEINGGKWMLLGSLEVKKGMTLSIMIGNNADQYVISDAVKFVPRALSEIIIDDDAAQYTGGWIRETASNINDRYGDAFHYSPWTNGNEPTATATYTFTAPYSQTYGIYAWWGVHPNRATNTPYTITTDTDSDTYRVNQEENGGQWNLIGTCEVVKDEIIKVVIGNNANEYVIADAIRLAPYTKPVEEDKLSALQELQMFVFSMNNTNTANCTKPSVVDAFLKALAYAEALCNSLDAPDEEILDAHQALLAAYDDVNLYQKINLALNKNVTASESVNVSGYWGPGFLTDGYIAPNNSGKIGYTTNDYKSKILVNPIQITIDLGSIKEFNTVALTPRMGSISWNGQVANFPLDFKLQVSADGIEYSTVYSVTNQQSPGFKALEIVFNKTEARYIRLYVTKLGEYAADEQIQGNPTPYRLQLSEIEVFNLEYDVSDIQLLTDSKIIEGYGANIPLSISSDNILGKELQLSLINDSGTYCEQTITATDNSFSFLYKLDKAPSAGNYAIIAKTTDGSFSGKCNLTIHHQNPDTLRPVLIKNESGNLRIRFANPISCKQGNNFNGLVKLGSYISNDTTIINGTDFSFVDVNDIAFDSIELNQNVVIQNVKFEDVFPSYSFTFTLDSK